MSAPRLTPEQFVERALEMLPCRGYKGFHAVYSGFNEAFRIYFPGQNPVVTIKELAKQGKIVVRPSKKGVTIYRKGDATPIPDGDQALAKMAL